MYVWFSRSVNCAWRYAINRHFICLRIHMLRKLLKSVLFTSVPMIALSYLYGFHGLWIWIIAFFCGMIFQADLGYREVFNIFKKDFQRELKYWQCRLRKHPLTDLPDGFYMADTYRHCKQCDALIRK